jgi:transcriptional regulator with XRE-family HTH domain
MYAYRTGFDKRQCTSKAMVRLFALVHPANMAKKPGHFLREWRKHRELTLEQVAERIELLSAARAAADPEVRPMSMTHATLSRIERGKLPYNQHLLELLADIYQADIPSLLIRDPQAADAIWSIWDQLRPVEREQVVEIAKTIRRTGTEG